MTRDRNAVPIVFIHGLWLHGESWNPWIAMFRDRGYTATAASWPGDGETTEATRRNAAALAGHGVAEIANHVAAQLAATGTKPIIIGHSLGGLLVQNLLARGLAAAGIAIDPAPIKGVRELPFSALKATLPVIGNPFNYRRAVPLSESEFRFGFTNAVSEQEAKELYARYAMPAPARPLFQIATAALNPGAATKVDVNNATRGPLLLVAGLEDNTVPPVLVRSAMREYHNSPAVTDYREFSGRGHSLTIDSGWPEIAEPCAAWLQRQGF